MQMIISVFSKKQKINLSFFFIDDDGVLSFEEIVTAMKVLGRQSSGSFLFYDSHHIIRKNVQ